VSSDWSTNSGIGAGVFYAKHEATASEEGIDLRDTAWANMPANPDPKWLKIHTEPYGVELATDSRPSSSQTTFAAKLSVVDTTGTGVSCSNRLRFGFLTPPGSNCVYVARIHVDGRYTQTRYDFDCVTNLQEVVAGGGYVDLPPLTQASNGVVYGTCDILRTNSQPSKLTIAGLGNGSCRIVGSGIPGRTYRIQFADDLANPHWLPLETAAANLSGVFGVIDSAGSRQRFYRIVLLQAGPRPSIESLRVTDGVATITWTSIAGQSYRLEYKDSPNDSNWHDLLAEVTATGTHTSLTNFIGKPNRRFYRAVYP
jgi:hypothetical protein